jgi:hypothetical protein
MTPLMNKTSATAAQHPACVFAPGWSPLSTAMWEHRRQSRSTGLQLAPSSAIVVGGKHKGNLEHLLMECHVELTVVDRSATVIDDLKQRFGSLSKYVAWKVGDVLDVDLPTHAYDLWFDADCYVRIACEGDRARYLAKMHRCVRAGGITIVEGHASRPSERSEDTQSQLCAAP